MLNYLKKISLLLALVFLVACQAGNTETKSQDQGPEKSVIYTSFFPIQDLTQQVVGDTMEVRSLMPKDKEVHDWEPSAKDLKDLSEAKCLIVNGAGLESWLPKVKDSLPDLKIIDLSQGLDLIPADHDHDHEDADHDHHHEEADHDHDGHDHGDLAYDPHTFLGPKNAIHFLDTITKEVQSLNPDHKEDYQKNGDQVKESLEGLIKDYQEKFAKADQKTFIVPHQAFAYLGRDFGLSQYPLQGLTSLDEPDLKTVQEAIEACKKFQVKAIFYEYGASPKAGQVIADEAGVNLLPLATMETQVKEGDHYQDLMKMNLENIAESLGL